MRTLKFLVRTFNNQQDNHQNEGSDGVPSALPGSDRLETEAELGFMIGTANRTVGGGQGIVRA